MDMREAASDCREVGARAGGSGRRWFVSASAGLDLVIWHHGQQLRALQFSGERAGRAWTLHWRLGQRTFQLSGVQTSAQTIRGYAASDLLGGPSPVSPQQARDALAGFVAVLPEHDAHWINSSIAPLLSCEAPHRGVGEQ